MPDTVDFFYVEKSEHQSVEVFINLTNVTRVQWDGTTMLVALSDGETVSVYGEAALRLRDDIGRRCTNRSLIPI